MNSKIQNSRTGMSYKKTKKVKKDTLYYITQKILGKITDIPLSEQDDDFNAKYQRIKRIKALIVKTYPFEELKDVKESSKYLYGLIELVFKNPHFEEILNKMTFNEELDIHEKREYFKSIKYILGKESLIKHPDYKKFKSTMELLDGVEDIQQSIEYDFDIIEYIDNNANDIKRVQEYINEYKDIMLTALNDLRKKMQLDMLELKEKKENTRNNEADEDSVIYKYSEVEYELQKNINIVNEKIIIIDCMGRSYKEIKEEGYLNNLPIDDVLYTNMKIDFK